MAQQNSIQFRGILLLLLFNALTGAFIYYGGEAYQRIGLAGLGSAQYLLGYILGIIQFLALAVLSQRLVQYVLLDWLLSSTIGTSPPRLLYQLSSFFIYALACAAIAGIIFKQDLTVILAASGALGVVIGLALQSLILDIFAGLAINLDRTIKIGDYIQLHKAGDETIEGKIEEISWRTMTVIDANRNYIILPNWVVSSSTITNFSSPEPCFYTTVSITLDSRIPVERATRILMAAAVDASNIFNRAEQSVAPTITVGEIIHIPKSIKYEISIHSTFETNDTVSHLVQKSIIKHLDIAGVRTTRLHIPSQKHLIYLLGSTVIFNGLTEAELQALIIQDNIYTVVPEQTIVLGGEVASSMFLVLEGLLCSEVKQKIGMKPLPAKILQPGYLICGKRVLTGDVYETTVMSKTHSLVLEIDYDALKQLFTAYPQAAHKIAHHTAKLLKQDQGDKGHWQVQETDLEAEILRYLQNVFALKITINHNETIKKSNI